MANGVDWTGDGRRVNGGFIGVLMQSLVFVPLLTCYFEDKKLSNESQGTKSPPVALSVKCWCQSTKVAPLSALNRRKM
jgi:hypothetical protein